MNTVTTKSRKDNKNSSESYAVRAARLKKLSKKAKAEGVRRIGGILEFKKWLYQKLVENYA